MAVTGFQKLTLAAVLALCVALLLPRTLLRREPRDVETAPGRFPPMMHRHVTPEPRGQRSAGVRGHGEVKGTGSGGAGTGSGPGGKSNLAAQIIPVYGFGILLYILYILFKITSKGSSKPTQSRLQSLRSENNKRKITDFELAQLQEKLRETELVMENIVNKNLQNDFSPVSVSVDQEQSLLQQLTDITRAMKNNKLVQDLGADWDQSGPVGADWDQTGPVGADWDQTGPVGADWDQTRADWDQPGPVGADWDQLGPDLVEDSELFWSRPHCSCTCPQIHEEEQHLEDRNTAVEEETHLEDLNTAVEEETHLEDLNTAVVEETHLEDQQTAEEEQLEDQQTAEEEQLEDQQTAEEEQLEDQQTVEEEQLEDWRTDLKTTEEIKAEKMESFPKMSNVRRRNRRKKGRKE